MGVPQVGLEDTLSDPDGDYNATTAQALSVSGLFSFSNANNQYGMLAFSTIYPDAPTKYLVMAVTQFTDFETLVASLSPDATMVRRSHFLCCCMLRGLDPHLDKH